MSKVLTKAKEHFKEIEQSTSQIDVPEWGAQKFIENRRVKFCTTIKSNSTTKPDKVQKH